MFATPMLTPLTTPVLPTVAIDVLPLLHVPPEVALNKLTVLPTQTLTAPDGVIAEGSAFTVTLAVPKQPVPSV